MAGGARSASLACTLSWTDAGAGLLQAPSWRVWLPGRTVTFHAPGFSAGVDHLRAPARVPLEPEGPVEVAAEAVPIEGFVA